MDIPLHIYKPNHPFSGRIVSNECLFGEIGFNEVRKIVIDLSESDFQWREGQCIGVIAPGLNDHNRHHPPRLYSIASCSEGEQGVTKHLAILVRRVNWTDQEGLEHRGIASNYLCDLNEGSQLNITGPCGRHFLFDQVDSESEVYIGTGTGCAPFRARLQSLFDCNSGHAKTNKKFSILLGFRKSMEIVDANFWKQIHDRFPHQVNVEYVFSRQEKNADGTRKYVGDVVAQNVMKLMNLISLQNASIYLCGIKGMEIGVEEAFSNYCEQNDLNWSEMKAQLMNHHRWIQEVY